MIRFHHAASAVLAAFAVFGVGCDPKRAPTEAAETRAIAVTEAPAATAVAPTLAGAAIDATARGLLSDETRAVVDASRLPVLLPRSLAGRGRLISQEHWYDFAYRSEGTEIHLKGLGVRHADVPFPPANETVAGRAVFLNRSEEILSASFEAHGIHYDAYIECGGRRCDDKAELLAFVGDLVLVGGGVR